LLLSVALGGHTSAEKARRYREERVQYWNSYQRRTLSRYYHDELARIYQFLVPTNCRVLELGCGEGDLLAALQPSHGVGVDFSPQMIQQAEARHPKLDFVLADVHQPGIRGTFDYVILSDLVNDLWDVQSCIEQLTLVCDARTRIVINSYSRLWELPLSMVRRLGLASPMISQNWLTIEDVCNILYLAGFEPIRNWQEILFPLRLPMVDRLSNSYLARLFPFRLGALSNFVIARPTPCPATANPPAETQVSVVIPARNEAGNIPEIFRRVPEMGAGTELIFVEGNSSDDTYGTIERAIADNPDRKSKLLKQDGKGKGDAVRKGFLASQGEILMILDADLTMPPEDLPRFYEALHSGKGEFINGARLIYPMEQEAMRFFNLIANKFFSLAFSWLLGQPLKDTLCGTKVLRKRDYEAIAANRQYFGDFDPYGDFDLLFGAAKLNLKFVDIPIRYAERTYGQTNIARWRGGWLLFRMTIFALRRLKFY
jgi:SAM-dependent methyltransferase